MTTHQLKCWSEYFKPISNNTKTFDLRKNDRGFKVGDDIAFEEYNPATSEYVGPVAIRRIVYMLEHFDGLMPGYCILGLAGIGRVTG